MAHYDIYRNGISIGTSTTTSFVDTTIASGTNYTYTVAAVNRDGYAERPVRGHRLALPSMISNDEPSSTQIEIYFSEPLTAGAASTASQLYRVGHDRFQRRPGPRQHQGDPDPFHGHDAGNGLHGHHDNLTTVSGNPLPASQTFTSPMLERRAARARSSGSITGTSAAARRSATLTSAASIRTIPTQTALETSFEAPTQHREHQLRRAAPRLHLSPHDRLLHLHASPAATAASCGSRPNSQSGEPGGDCPGRYVHRLPRLVQREQPEPDVRLDLPDGGAALLHHGAGEARQRRSGDNLSVRWEIPATTGGAASTWELNSSGVADSTIPIPGIRLSPPSTPRTRRRRRPPRISSATVTGSNTQITLAWSPVLGLPSGVDHYNIYRNGSLYATSTTTSYVDSSGISSQTRHSYQVTAVNFDGIEGVKSAAVTAVPVGIAAIMTPTPRRSRSSSPSPSIPRRRQPWRTTRSAASRSARPSASRRLHRHPDHLRPGHRQPYVDRQQRQDAGPGVPAGGHPADLDVHFHLSDGHPQLLSAHVYDCRQYTVHQ